MKDPEYQLRPKSYGHLLPGDDPVLGMLSEPLFILPKNWHVLYLIISILKIAKLPLAFPARQEEVGRMAVNFVPLHDRILIRRVEEQETTRGGLIIPDTAKDKPQEGEVLAVGKGKIKEDGKVLPLDVKPGDRILFGKYAGTEIKIDGEEYLIMREDEVLGVLAKAGKRAKVAA